MDRFVIRGGVPRVGEVQIGGAKNAALAILAAAVMTNDPVRIENVPDVTDCNVLLKAMERIGVGIIRQSKHVVVIDGSKIESCIIEDEYLKRIRASYYLVGALLGKNRQAEVPLPGGCNIGVRAIDQHIKGFRALGAKVDIGHGAICAEAKELRGSHIFLDKVSVGATINIMMAAALATGKTIIENAAKEPHVVDLANFLNSMGANIKGAGTDVSRVWRSCTARITRSYRTRSRQAPICWHLRQPTETCWYAMSFPSIWNASRQSCVRSAATSRNTMMR